MCVCDVCAPGMRACYARMNCLACMFLMCVLSACMYVCYVRTLCMYVMNVCVCYIMRERYVCTLGMSVLLCM